MLKVLSFKKAYIIRIVMVYSAIVLSDIFVCNIHIIDNVIIVGNIISTSVFNYLLTELKYTNKSHWT